MGFHVTTPWNYDRLIIEPVRKRGLIALLKTMKPLKEKYLKIDDAVPAPEKVL
jgi:antitoxin VapB